MRNTSLFLALTALISFPALGYAQGGPAAGAVTGAVGGAIVGGPVGAVVGGVAGAVVGGIVESDRPRFRTYVQGRNLKPNKWDGDVVVGKPLPGSIEYYEVPSEYKVQNYRYTVVNGHTVLVDPTTHAIVEVID